jgi:protein OS-9
VRDPRTPQFVLGRARKIPGQDSKTHGKFYDDGSNDRPNGGSDIELRGSKEDSDYYEEDLQGNLQDNGDNRYLAHKMKSGTLCDLTMRPREIEIQYHCLATSTSDRIAWIKEVTTCSYLMVVNTPRLCTDVAFQPQPPAESHEILCKPIIGEAGTDSSATDTAPQEPARSGEAEAGATSSNAADILKSLAKENDKVKPLVIGGTVVGGGEYFPAADPPLLKPPPFWNAASRAKKPIMIAKSDTKVTAGSGKGGNAAAEADGSPDPKKLTAAVNARLETDGKVAIEILAHGVGQSDSYHMMNDEGLKAIGMSPKVVQGLAEKLRKAAGPKAWTLALVEGEGVDGREVRGVIDAAGVEVEGAGEEGWEDDVKEWAWDEVEKLIFGEEAEDKTKEWKEQVQKSKKTGKSEKGEGKGKVEQQDDGTDEEEGSEEVYYKDEL